MQVLINGAGGGAGSFAVQLARLYGAEVTGVDNTGKQELMRSLGAHHLIDYTREDFTRNGKTYDLVLDLVAHRSVFACQRAEAGRELYFVGGSMGVLFQVLLLGPWIRRASGKQVRILAVQPNRKDLEEIAALCAAGKITPAIDRHYPLSQVPEALRRLGADQAQGKIVISIDHAHFIYLPSPELLTPNSYPNS
jgi:NADPH:quinone reductase-like Zn-dependent oxidoreductase